MLNYEIIGSDLQLVEIRLRPGEVVKAETGSMVFMERGIVMSTSSGGGFLSGFKRMMSGAGFFISQFANELSSGSAVIGFSAPYPGKVMAIDLRDHGGELIAEKNAFLCASENVEIDVALTRRFSAGLFGGEGFILQRMSGQEQVFIHAGGTLVQKELQVVEELIVDTGCLCAFEGSIKYEIERVKGVTNMLFGSEGMFFVKLTGPGKVYVQSMPFAKLAHSIARMLPQE